MRLRLRHPRSISGPALRKLLHFLMHRAARLNPHRSWEEVSFSLLHRSPMRRVNERVFGRTTETDVITLAYRPIPGSSGWVGEVFINADLALEKGPRFGGPAHELALYLAHGCDHLADASDDTPTGRRQMRARELQWLRQAERAGLIAPLFRTSQKGPS